MSTKSLLMMYCHFLIKQSKITELLDLCKELPLLDIEPELQEYFLEEVLKSDSAGKTDVRYWFGSFLFSQGKDLERAKKLLKQEAERCLKNRVSIEQLTMIYSTLVHVKLFPRKRQQLLEFLMQGEAYLPPWWGSSIVSRSGIREELATLLLSGEEGIHVDAERAKKLLREAGMYALKEWASNASLRNIFAKLSQFDILPEMRRQLLEKIIETDPQNCENEENLLLHLKGEGMAERDLILG